MSSYQLSPAQLELQASRRAAKQAKRATAQIGTPDSSSSSKADEARGQFLHREWIRVRDDPDRLKNRVKIVTWNMLAQTLVRRELFPGSDCLKWSERKALLLAEMGIHAQADIVCLQECDRLPDILPAFPEHEYVEARGPGKRHGLVVFYRSAKWRVRATRTVYLDDEELSPLHEANGGDVSDGSTGDRDLSDARRRRGGSRQTKNVGLIVGLESADEVVGNGIVIATTHLFWHPKFTYERIRQSVILVRAIRAFKKTHECDSWPAVLAGDLNTTPSEATYQLLTSPSQPLHQSMIQEIEISRFVHTSVTNIAGPLLEDIPSASGTGTNTLAEKDDEEEIPDSRERSVAKTRDPTPSDGILDTDKLVELVRSVLPEGLRSAYGSSDWVGGGGETFEKRGGFERLAGKEMAGLQGGMEPGYTCFTPLFKLTLGTFYRRLGTKR